jgi:hypothetical protein
MNLLGFRLLNDSSEDARAAGAAQVASNKTLSPSGDRGQSPRNTKGATDASPRSEFQNLLAADEALPHAPSPKPAKKTSTETFAPAPIVDPARLAGALAERSCRTESSPPVVALPLATGSSLLVGADADTALDDAPSRDEEATDRAAASTVTDGPPANAPAPSPAIVAPADAQLAVAVASLPSPTLDRSRLPGVASSEASAPSPLASSHVRAPVESPHAPTDARVAEASAAPRIARASETRDAGAASPRASSDENPADTSSDAHPSATGSLSEARVDSGTAPPAQRVPGSAMDAKSTSGDAYPDRASAPRAQASSSATRSAAGSAPDASIGSVATSAVPFADAPPSVNLMTSAKGMSAVERPLDSASGSPDTTAATSIVNQQIIRGAAHGVIELPELGRIQVSARSQDGELGVRVTADRPETATILLPHTAAMAAEARAPGSSNVRVDVESRHATMGSYTGSSGGSGRETARQAPTDPDEGDEAVDVSQAAVRPRVRIVL